MTRARAAAVLLASTLLSAMLALAATRAAHAYEPSAARDDGGSPYALDWGIDGPLFALGLAGVSLNFVEVPPAPCLPHCEAPADMNALDRRVLGKYSPDAHTAADVMVAALLAAPQLLNLADSGGRGWFEDTAVALQALMFTQGAVQLTKFAVRRGAPILYDDGVPLEERQGRDASRSFFSGHTATAFVAASSYTTTYWLRHPDDPWRWVVLAGTHSLAMAVGLLKVHAGYHYWTDVGAGALVGSSIGVLVPMLHRRF
jgi:membrane-associated phospholipid phosphatase